MTGLAGSSTNLGYATLGSVKVTLDRIRGDFRYQTQPSKQAVYEKARAGAQRQLCDFGKCIEIAHVRYALVPGLTFPQAKPLKLASK